MARHGSIASLGVFDPVPESPPPAPGSPDSTDMIVHAIMAQLSALERALARSQAENRAGYAELEKVKTENNMPRQALVKTQDDEAATDPRQFRARAPR